MEKTKRIKLSNLDESPFQGRIIPNEKGEQHALVGRLKSLADSISAHGLANPIIVRQMNDRFEIIDGHRRTEAFKMLGRGDILAIVKDFDDRQAQIHSVIGNLQRENLSSIERALAFRKILDKGLFKDKRELSRVIGKDETYIGDLLNTLNLDHRIIDDLVKHRTTDDVRLLRIIRRVESVNGKKESKKQFDLYMRFKHGQLSRLQVVKLARSERVAKKDEVQIRFKGKKMVVEFPSVITKEEQALLEAELPKLLGK